MQSEIIVSLTTTFEGHAQQTDGEIEYWLARDLQHLLGYTEWLNFLAAISKAKTVCAVSGHAISDHFVDVNKTIQMPLIAMEIGEFRMLNWDYITKASKPAHHIADSGKMVAECRWFGCFLGCMSFARHHWSIPEVSFDFWTTLELLKRAPQSIIQSTHPLRLACIAVTRISSGFFLRLPNVFRLEGTV